MMFRSIPIDILILAHFYTGVRCHLCRQKPCCIFRSTVSGVSDNSEIKQVETRIDVKSRFTNSKWEFYKHSSSFEELLLSHWHKRTNYWN
ncbi:hypothetical protein NP493_88g02069 [Ridgeia piscesae]|uniref:Secreted protein n=1 Tax=Ridgeia piscesae TaxID=27915 RepID=A0AAD9P8G3_RIDPI|nr:hypothetical protein NP493_88g02069 [Ridgeia piscesae]